MHEPDHIIVAPNKMFLPSTGARVYHRVPREGSTHHRVQYPVPISADQYHHTLAQYQLIKTQ